MHRFPPSKDTAVRPRHRTPSHRRLARAITIAAALAVTACGSAAERSAPSRSASDRTPASALPGWGRGDQASVNLLRRAIAREADFSQVGLARCERQAGHATPATRRRAYRACALLPLARTAAAAHANGSMLTGIAENRSTAESCREQIGALAGTTGVLSQIAQAAMRQQGSLAWPDLLAASRAIRGMAEDARRLARARGWSLACQPQPSRPGTPLA